MVVSGTATGGTPRERRGNPLFAHPAFDHYRQWLPAAGLPDLATLDALATAMPLQRPGATLRFVAGRACSALEYEARIAATGTIPMRPDSVHDICNALVWLAMPRTKLALNAVHVAEGAAHGGGRGRRRDAATLLDESGVVLACADATLPDLLRERAWPELFITRRSAVALSLRALVCGHGLLAKLLKPFRAITARALIVPVGNMDLPDTPAGWAAVDLAAALAVAGPEFTVESLLPLPLAALPGWDTENLGERLFDDTSVFRPRMLRCPS